MNILFPSSNNTNNTTESSIDLPHDSKGGNDHETALFDLLDDYHLRLLQKKKKKIIDDDDDDDDASRSKKNSSNNKKKIQEDDNDEELLYRKIVMLIQQNPNIVHAMNVDGYTALQLICSNPLLAANIRLIKLLVDTSAQLEWEHDNPDFVGNMTPADRKRRQSGITMTNNRNDFFQKYNQYNVTKGNNSTDSTLASTPAKVIYQKSKNDDQMVLHIACLNAAYTTIDVIEYILRCHPSAVCHKNKMNGNLPIHNACIASTVSIVPIELIILLTQQWPESLREVNYDGNLPLHLVCHIYYHKLTNSTLEQSQMKRRSSTTTPASPSGRTSDTSRYDYQLQIIQYIVDYYPESVFMKNKSNETPSQIAFQSSQNFYDIDELGDSDHYDTTIKRRQRQLHPIVSFLYDFENRLTKHNEEEEQKQKQLQQQVGALLQNIELNNKSRNVDPNRNNTSRTRSEEVTVPATMANTETTASLTSATTNTTSTSPTTSTDTTLTPPFPSYTAITTTDRSYSAGDIDNTYNDNNGYRMNRSHGGSLHVSTTNHNKDDDFVIDETGRKTRVVKTGAIARKKSGDLAEGIMANPWKVSTRQSIVRRKNKVKDEDPLEQLQVLTSEDEDDIYASSHVKMISPIATKRNSKKNKKFELIDDDDDDDDDGEESVVRYLKEGTLFDELEDSNRRPVSRTKSTDAMPKVSVSPSGTTTATTNTIASTVTDDDNVLGDLMKGKEKYNNNATTTSVAAISQGIRANLTSNDGSNKAMGHRKIPRRKKPKRRCSIDSIDDTDMYINADIEEGDEDDNDDDDEESDADESEDKHENKGEKNSDNMKNNDETEEKITLLGGVGRFGSMIMKGITGSSNTKGEKQLDDESDEKQKLGDTDEKKKLLGISTIVSMKGITNSLKVDRSRLRSLSPVRRLSPHNSNNKSSSPLRTTNKTSSKSPIRNADDFVNSIRSAACEEIPPPPKLLFKRSSSFKHVSKNNELHNISDGDRYLSSSVHETRSSRWNDKYNQKNNRGLRSSSPTLHSPVGSGKRKVRMGITNSLPDGSPTRHNTDSYKPPTSNFSHYEQETETKLLQEYYNHKQGHVEMEGSQIIGSDSFATHETPIITNVRPASARRRSGTRTSDHNKRKSEFSYSKNYNQGSALSGLSYDDDDDDDNDQDDSFASLSKEDESDTGHNNPSDDKLNYAEQFNEEIKAKEVRQKRAAYRRRLAQMTNDPTSESLEI